MENKNKPLFVDTGAFIALYVKSDQCHKDAIKFLKYARKGNLKFVTSNFIFNESVTWMLYKAGKKLAMEFGEYFLENSDIFPIKQILPEDEKRAWELFKDIPTDVSFTDCTSFSLMERFGINYTFTFDKHFTDAGYEKLPDIY